MGKRVWFGQGKHHVSLVSLTVRFQIHEVSGEWWLYSYEGVGDIVPPSVHKTEVAARRRARKVAIEWLEAKIKMVKERG